MQIGFEVGAKAARLIGRENITDVDGALIELIKNAYDADATCVYVRFHMPFPEVPDRLSAAGIKELLSAEDYSEILKFYEVKENQLVKNKLTEDQVEALKDMLAKYNQIVLIDNGSGMDEQTVRTSWMQIGTSDKEKEIESDKGRIKTGAKGIGRFALDKLSTCSRMYTRKTDEDLLYWEVDWNQFTGAKLLKDVKASIEIQEYSYLDFCKEWMGKDYRQYEKYGWDQGTAFVLSPCRGEWSRRLFDKVNNALKSINPLGFSDTFDIYLKNVQSPEYNFEPQESSISESDYDYQIEMEYDGDETLRVILERNEVDVNKRVVNVKLPSKEIIKVSTEEFWARPALQKKDFQRKDFGRTLTFEYNVYNLLGKNDSLEKIKRVGPFSGKLYFLKNANSDFDIMKRVKPRKRRELVEKFSGIKIYRDNFKVRPYGDPGSLKDWLDLSARQQVENQSAANLTAPWRVLPYQMIGSINISRIANPELFDMANRESLTMNESFYIFRDILINTLSVFEYDRQYIYREYKRWTDEKIKEHSPVAERVKGSVESKKNKKQDKEQDKRQKEDSGPSESSGQQGYEEEFTKDEYEETIADLLNEGRGKLHAEQILHMITGSGLIMNTFFHEFRSIAAQLRVRAPQLRRCVNYILNDEEFHGDEIYDPYMRLKDLQETDEILKDWLDIAMLGTDEENLDPTVLEIGDEIKQILRKWEPILDKQYICLDQSSIAEEIYVKASRTDLYIIVNNFVLNSVSYLEKCTGDKRIISIKLGKDKANARLLMENNGPMLDEELRSMPDRIFELGFSTKRDSDGKKGTGIGLWAVREAVQRGSGFVSVDVERKEGFGLVLELPMEVSDGQNRDH